ncbi:MAG: c-type cytochrome [Flavobacteriales bacterium]|tara:strand:+ start:397 stop:1695 length:1299 start_codon:yes stop_codon:yes gene_type:complete
MNKIINIIRAISLLKVSLFCLSFLLFQVDSFSQDTEKGKKLFKANCAACHSVGSKKVVGPGLQGVGGKYEREWLGKWIKNSGALIASGDADAKAIFEEYNKSIMPPQAVNEEDIDDILAYIANPTKGVEVAPEVGTVLLVAEEVDNSMMLYLFIGVIILLLVLIITLNNTGVFVKEVIAKDAGNTYDGPKTLIESFKKLMSDNKGIVATIVIVLFFGGLVNLMDGAFTIGVHEGYKPEQPIKFSHKIHAGDDKIDCNYCHSGARHSKSSGIPSLNLCMNCHKAIDGSDGKVFTYNGEQYSMVEEIKKIYEHLDYDPETGEYGDNTTPVKWIKVHNLPDHVFFSHAQHVTVGEQKCQTCHGPVEEMDVVEQYSALTMKWCIECHQETSVVTKDNGYYDDMHDRMTPEFKEKVLDDGTLTVQEIGGWECAKCHY